MEMMNRAIEDASDFMEMKRKLMADHEQRFAEMAKQMQRERLETEKLTIDVSRPILPKRPGENREQYRARIHSKG